MERVPVTEETQNLVVEEPGQQNWKLTLAYDGTDFCGWQIQPGEPTIQGQLQEALRRVVGEAPLPQGSGRTDAGVHALGQVASFALQARIPADNLMRALNRTLPASIRILEAKIVKETFHARHSSMGKIYEYRIFCGAVCPPFLARYVHCCPWPICLEALQRSAAYFVGNHNFLSFAATDPDLASRNFLATIENLDRPIIPATAVRTIFSSEWEEQKTPDGRLLVYRIYGRSFLHHMVRNLVGTMMDTGRGYRRVEEIPEMIAAQDRSAAGPTAPAQGLFLHTVHYNPADE